MATDREDVIVFVSGDDYLYCDDALEHLNEVYKEDVWFTYGNFIRTSGLHGEGCYPIPDTRAYRKSGAWLASHLVTCKKKLFDKIRDEDLRYENGQYPNHSFDCAMIYPMVEICGQEHMRFVKKVLYVYNDQNPLAKELHKLDPKACLRERAYYISKPQYDQLTEL